MSTAASDGATNDGLSLLDRLLAIVSMRGNVGITQDELLRKLGVPYEDLREALHRLRAEGLVRVHWPTPDSFRVFYTG